MEVFLYRCIRCGNVICKIDDMGYRFYLDKCYGCNDWSDYEKIVCSILKNKFLVKDEEKDEEG